MELGRGGHRYWWRGRGCEDLVQVGDAEVHPGHQQQPRVLRLLVPGQPGEQREGGQEIIIYTVQAVLYSSGLNLTIKPLAPNSKPIQWRGGEGLILTCDWSASTGRIVTGGEECR